MNERIKEHVGLQKTRVSKRAVHPEGTAEAKTTTEPVSAAPLTRNPTFCETSFYKHGFSSSYQKSLTRACQERLSTVATHCLASDSN